MSEDKNTEVEQAAIEPEAIEGADELAAVEPAGTDIDLAAGLFAGKVATVNELCRGNIRLAGMLSMVDNINRILDRAAVYLS